MDLRARALRHPSAYIRRGKCHVATHVTYLLSVILPLLKHWQIVLWSWVSLLHFRSTSSSFTNTSSSIPFSIPSSPLVFFCVPLFFSNFYLSCKRMRSSIPCICGNPYISVPTFCSVAATFSSLAVSLLRVEYFLQLWNEHVTCVFSVIIRHHANAEPPACLLYTSRCV